MQSKTEVRAIDNDTDSKAASVVVRSAPRRLVYWMALAISLIVTSTAQSDLSAERELSFRHTHTNETLTIVYWRDGAYLPAALERINRFLRDFRTDEQTTMDPALLDLLHTIYERTGSEGQFEIISAYRSPKTNEMLRRKSNGVAKKSQHLLGKAIDVRLTDVPIRKLREVAYDLGRGGVGFYGKSRFVHLDTGRFRTW